MASAVYPIWKEAIIQASSNSSLGGSGTTGVYSAMVDTGTYTYSAAHDFYNDLSGIVGTDQEIGSKTFVTGTFDGADVTYTAVSGASVEALVLYVKNAGANTTWRLVLYDEVTSVTPNGGDITVQWNASGIFTLSDLRVKEAIVEIGKVGNVLSLCEYNYVGQKDRHVGLIAQDVERRVPSAVAEVGGLKMVDYYTAFEWAKAA